MVFRTTCTCYSTRENSLCGVGVVISPSTLAVRHAFATAVVCNVDVLQRLIVDS